MLLEDWLDKRSISMREFARMIGARCHTTVYRYLGKERRIPDKRLAVNIYIATDGEVQPNDFYPLPDKPAHKKRAPRQTK
jgi:hypothetical protein